MSESCSIIDENESVHVEQVNSNSSSGSKNSDKENSNIRNNKTSTNRSVSSHMSQLNPQTRVSLKANRSIRVAPSFKGMQGVLKVNDSQASKTVLIKKKVSEPSDSKPPSRANNHIVSQKQIQSISSASNPIVLHTETDSNVYHIIGKNSIKQSVSTKSKSG